MRFVIDETCWQFDGVDTNCCVDIIEDMLDLVDHIIEHGQRLCYSDDLFLAPVRDGKTFYELYADDSPIEIPHDVRERIAAIFGRLQPWQDLNLAWPNSFDVIIEGGHPNVLPPLLGLTREQASERLTLLPASSTVSVARADRST